MPRLVIAALGRAAHAEHRRSRLAAIVVLAGASAGLLSASAAASRSFRLLPGVQRVTTDGDRYVALLSQAGWAFIDERRPMSPAISLPGRCGYYLGAGYAYCDDYKTMIELSTGRALAISGGDRLQAGIQRLETEDQANELIFIPDAVGSQWLRFRGESHTGLYGWVYFNWRTGRFLFTATRGSRSIDNLNAPGNPRKPSRPCRPLHYPTYYSASERERLFAFMLYQPPFGVRHAPRTGAITLLRCGTTKKRRIAVGRQLWLARSYLIWGGSDFRFDFRLSAYRLKDGKRFSWSIPQDANFTGAQGALALTDHHIYLNALGTTEPRAFVATAP